MREKRNPLSHVIASQGYPRTFGKYKMQVWVENMNRILRDEGYKVSVFTCGENERRYTRKNHSRKYRKSSGKIGYTEV